MKKLMRSRNKLNLFALVILCTWLCACKASDSGVDTTIGSQDKAEITGEAAVGLILELQRLYILCRKLEPAKSKLLASQYRSAKLIEFEKFMPIDQNPYVAVINDPSTFDAAYVNVDPKIRAEALAECSTNYPKELNRLKLQESEVREAIVLQQRNFEALIDEDSDKENGIDINGQPLDGE